MIPSKGDRVRMVGIMPDDPCPMEVGAEGTVVSIGDVVAGRRQIDVDWDEEAWLPVVGYEGHYEVSSLGRVASVKRGQREVLTPWFNPQHDYPTVGLSKDGKKRNRAVHLIVADAFLGPKERSDVEVRHANNDRRDSRLANLSYGTKGDNTLDSVVHGTHNNARKTHCPQGHSYDDENTLRSKGKRVCRTCKRERDERYRQARKERRGLILLDSDPFVIVQTVEERKAWEQAARFAAENEQERGQDR